MPRDFWGEDGKVALKPPEFVEHVQERVDVMRKEADPDTGNKIPFTAEMLWLYSELEQVIRQMGPAVGIAAMAHMENQAADLKATNEGGKDN